MSDPHSASLESASSANINSRPNGSSSSGSEINNQQRQLLRPARRSKRFSRMITSWRIPNLVWIWIIYVYESMLSFVMELGSGILYLLSRKSRNNNGNSNIAGNIGVRGDGGSMQRMIMNRGGLGGGGMPDLEIVPRHGIEVGGRNAREDSITINLVDDDNSAMRQGVTARGGVNCRQPSRIPSTTGAITTTISASNGTLIANNSIMPQDPNGIRTSPAYNTDIEPAFLSAEEYPPGWLVYDPVRGTLIPKAEIITI